MSELCIKEQLVDRGYADVEIDLTRQDLEGTMHAYLGFLTLPEHFKKATVFDLTDRGDGDFGQYTRIAGSDSKRGEVPDNKDIFHFGAQTRQVVEARLGGKTPKELKDFLNSAENIFWEAQATKRQAVRNLSPGLTGIMSPDLAPLNDVLRFIAYYPNAGKLAKSHFDRSVTTLAIGESHEGLHIAPGQNGMVIDCNQEYLDGLEKGLTPVDHQEGRAKFFLGAGWNRLDSPHGKWGADGMPLGYHAVHESDTTVDENLMRWAIVQFSNPYVGYERYTVPTPAETRPYKQLGRIAI